MAIEAKVPVQVVTHCYGEENGLEKGNISGKLESIGKENLYHPQFFPEQRIHVFITSILQSQEDGRIYVISYPYYYGGMNWKSLMAGYGDYLGPEFAEGIRRKDLKGPNNGKVPNVPPEVLTKLGMVAHFCYPCPSDILAGGMDMQLIMNGDSIEAHRQEPKFMADMPIGLSVNLEQRQGASFQINYSSLYELLESVFPGRVKVADISPR